MHMAARAGFGSGKAESVTADVLGFWMSNGCLKLSGEPRLEVLAGPGKGGRVLA